MLVAVAQNAVADDARADERDVLAQADAVSQALEQLGHAVERVPVTLNLESFMERLTRIRPDIVFNLAESLGGSDRLASLAAAVVERLGLPLTGSSSDTLWLSNHKTMTKRRLVDFDLPTPFWHDPGEFAATWHDEFGGHGDAAGFGEWPVGTRFIIKPLFEHASLGMDGTSIVAPRNRDELDDLVRRRSESLGEPCFAEEFIDGRELNLSLLAGDDGCELLPLAEIDFSAFPVGKPRIVDYVAKWDPSSFEYHHTPRRFLSPESEPTLHTELSRIGSRCWRQFQLGGHVRIDVRLDTAGKPWILEINTNPCLAPDAGFPAALVEAKIEFAGAIERILEDAMRRGGAGKRRFAVSQTPKDEASRAMPPAEPIRRPHVLGTGAAGISSGMDRHATPAAGIQWRYEVCESDPANVRGLVAATGFFYPDEVAVAEELVVERLHQGESSGYGFVFAERDGELVGYACYGAIACAHGSFDLYWIAVHPRVQRLGAGKLILSEAELRIRRGGGRRVYIETSSREQYLPTRTFYERCGYHRDAILAEFYGPGDGKVIYVKSVAE